MKNVIIGLLTLGSVTVFSVQAQIIDVDPSIQHSMQELLELNSSSEEVSRIVQKVEAKYNVKCEGSSKTIFPDLTKRITFNTRCEGQNPLTLIIRSKFKRASPSCLQPSSKYYFEVMDVKLKLDK